MQFFNLVLAFAAVIAGCQIIPLRTLVADWPEFRGPTAQGVVLGELPIRWSADENVAWRCELPGEGWSSPVVSGDQIYLTAAVPLNDGGFSLSLLIVEAKTGSLQSEVELFRQEKSAPAIHRKNSHASPTPIIDGPFVYLHFGHQGTACCQLDGTIVWKNAELAYAPVHGNGGSPVVAGNLLIFARDGGRISQVTALDKATGQLAWTRERNASAAKQFSFCTPLIICHLGREQVVIPGSDVVQSLDPTTGEELWRVRYAGYSVVPRPLYHNGLVFVSTGYDNPKLLAIDPSGQGDITKTHVKWTAETSVPKTPSLIGRESTVLMISDNGIVTCLDADNGELVWRNRVGGEFSASPLLSQVHMYILSESGVCTLLDISGGKPAILSSNALEERTLASPSVIGESLLIRTSKALYRISRSPS